MKTLEHRGKEYQVKRSNRKGKSHMIIYKDKEIHFGAKGMRDYPGTKRGDNYCARSSGIKGVNDPNSPNYWSRKMWKCKGKKSVRTK